MTLPAQRNRHIYIYSPSGAVRDRSAFERGIARLKAMGHEVEVDIDALTVHTRFAGDDATRLAAIHRAAASGADMALISRGGYGMTRILANIHYAQLARAAERGMKFVGLSDFTALQNALLAHTGAVTWAGPALLADLGAIAAPNEGMLACLDDVLHGHHKGIRWCIHRQASTTSAIPSAWHVPAAPLWGGNLAVLCALVGTPYLPHIEGGILFLEDTGEHPYRIERMLGQLLHAGVLARQHAIVLGQFTDYRLAPHDNGFTLHSVVQWLRTRVPTLTNLPFGHVPAKVLLPVGAQVTLSVKGGDARLEWGQQ